MHLSKLVTALQSLDEDRFKRLGDYIRSPFFKVPTHSVNLFNFLEPLYPKFPEKKVTIENIAVVAQNLSTFSKQARAGSELLERIQDFMAYENWDKDQKAKRFNQVRAYNEHQLITQFNWGFEDGMKELTQDPEQDVQTFLYRHLLTELSFNGFAAKLNRTVQNDIKPVITSLDEFYALKRLRYMVEAQSRNQVLGTAYDDTQVKALLKTLEPYTNDKYPYVYLFVNVYRMMEEHVYEESDLYYRFIKQFIESDDKGPVSVSVTEVLIYAINNRLKWFNLGHTAAGDDYLWCVEWQMDRNLLLKDLKLQPITFRNIITIATINKYKVDWIDQAIKKYSQYLPEEYKDTYLNFGRGLYHYARKDHKEASRSFLSAQAKEEPIFNSIIRCWQWMSSFECDPFDTDTLLNQLLSFQKYLARNQNELRSVAKPFNQFISYSEKLVKATKEQAENFLLELKSEEHFPGSLWLAEQLQQKTKTGTRAAAAIGARS